MKAVEWGELGSGLYTPHNPQEDPCKPLQAPTSKPLAIQTGFKQGGNRAGKGALERVALLVLK